MPRRFKILLAAAGVILCAMIAWQSLRPRTVFDATYHGHALEWWLDRLELSAGPPERPECLTAIRVLCTNHLPELVAALDYNPVPRQARMVSKFSWLPGPLYYLLVQVGPFKDRAEARAQIAARAFKALGPDAASAAPALEKLTWSPGQIGSLRLYLCLSRLGPDGVKSLLAAMEDENSPRRLTALQAFGMSTSVWGTNTPPEALPVLLRCLRSSDSRVVGFAAVGLGLTKMDPARSVPALVAALGSSNAITRFRVVGALGEFEKAARPAVPALMGALNDPSAQVREQAQLSLESVAPEVLTNTPSVTADEKK